MLAPCVPSLSVVRHPDFFIESIDRDARFSVLGSEESNPAYPTEWPFFDGLSLAQYDQGRYRLLRGQIGGTLSVRAPVQRGTGLSPWSQHWSSTERCDDYAGFCDVSDSKWCVPDEEWYWVNRANGAWGRPFLVPLSEAPPVGDYQLLSFTADRIPLDRQAVNTIELRRREDGCGSIDPLHPDGTVESRIRITVDPALIILPVEVFVFARGVKEPDVLSWFGQGAQHTWMTERYLGEQCRIRGTCYEDKDRAWFRSTRAERLVDAGREREAYRLLFLDRIGERIDLMWAQCGIQFEPVTVHFPEGDDAPEDCGAARAQLYDLVRPGRITIGLFSRWDDSVGCSYPPPARVAMTTTENLKQYGHWSHGYSSYGSADEMTNEILAHEIGHNLTLNHEDPPVTGPDGRWNLMHPSVDSPYGGTRLVAEQCEAARAAALRILAETPDGVEKAKTEVKP